jgi:hypothetical protein
MEWNGAIVDRADAEQRNQQDFVRAKADKQSVPNPRPVESVANASFVGTSTTASLTASAFAGARTIAVDAVAGFAIGDTVAIMLDSLDRHLNTVAAVGGTSLTLVNPLPGPASSGNMVIDYTALVAAKIE